MKLGKLPAKDDPRTLRLAEYVDSSKLPTPPRRFGHEDVFGWSSWGELGNDKAGDCVWAGAAHETMLLTAIGDPETAKFTDESVLKDYSAVTGYKPDDPSTDQGTFTLDALKYRQNIGVLDANGQRHKIGAYVSLQLGNLTHLYQALYLFGVVGIGIRFPTSAMDQFSRGASWNVVSGSPIEGGHYIPIVARRGWFSESIVCVTWGRTQPMTPKFYLEYCDEAWAILSPEMLVKGKSLEGFDLPALQADLQRLQG